MDRSPTEYQRRVREAAAKLARHYLRPVENADGGIDLESDEAVEIIADGVLDSFTGNEDDWPDHVVMPIDPAGDRERHLSCSRTELRELLYATMAGIEAEAGLSSPTEGRIVLASRLTTAILDAFDVEAGGF